jgi:hypothetical protein
MTRNELHALVDSLSDAEAANVALLLDAYRRGDRAMIHALIAPTVPATALERRVLAEAASTQGSGVSLEAYEEKYGLPPPSLSE